jgi:hypothetical protein
MTQHDQAVGSSSTIARYITHWIDDRLYVFDVITSAFFELNAPAGHAFERLLAGIALELIVAEAPEPFRDACRAFLLEVRR